MRPHSPAPTAVRGTLATGLVVLFLLPAQLAVAEGGAPLAAPTLTEAQLGFLDHIDHIVFVVLENHAYDNYFGTYCTAVSPVCPYTANGLPSGTCVPYYPQNLSRGCVRPWNYTAVNWTLRAPLPHDYGSSTLAWNHGLMNNFYRAEYSGIVPFGHYNATTAPTYWDMAEEYALSDNFFSSVLSYSLPNHWHIVAGQAPQIVLRSIPVGGATIPANQTITIDHTYLNEANQTKSIEDLLLNSTVSWKYYDYPLGNYSRAIHLTLGKSKEHVVAGGSAYNFWNPLAAKAESYNSSFVSHYVENTQFYNDSKNGTLPDISWVIPSGQDSDHPSDNSTVAQGWLASIVDAVESSPEWNSTALYVTWDDYGGFYDHVAPPKLYGQQLGFRVPLLEISAWTQPGSVSNQTGYFESVLRLMEWRFNLGCITTLDCKAPLPLFGFEWNLKQPRAAILFPTDFDHSNYPYDSQWDGGAAVEPGSYVPPSEYTVFPEGEAPDID